MILNPVAQIQKGQDAQRQHDLKQLATALDSYYNDKNYYPTDLTFLVGAKNIQAIPNDPVSSSWKNYSYLEEQGNTPQWNVLFGKLAVPASSQSSFSCPLTKMTDSSGGSCLPNGYLDLGYNYCIISGSVNCNVITTMNITPLPVHIPSAVDTPTPAPVQVYCSCSEARFGFDAVNGCGAVTPAGADTSSYYNRYCDLDSNHACIHPCTR
jgi:type II secretory pathway pseudopilin PulG